MAKGSKSRSRTSIRTARRSYPASNRRLSVLHNYNLFRLPTIYELLAPPEPMYRARPSFVPDYPNRNLERSTVHPVDAPDPHDMVQAVRHCQARGERREVLFAIGRTGKGSARGPRRPKSEVKC